jgi:hypothetical protein
VHLPEEGHDFGINKRKAVYAFMIKYLGLNNDTDESKITIEKEEAMYVFNGKLPANAIHGFEQLEKLWNAK